MVIAKNISLKIVCAVALFLPYMVHAQTKADALLNQKINRIIKKMTLAEKIEMVHGNALFSSGGVKRLNIPELTCDDGPLGVRDEVLRFDWKSADLTTDSATFLPNGSALAATWNVGMANLYGTVLGEEANARKKTVILAPAFNICRMPLCGRTYEYYSEDPFLNAQLAVQAVKGIQSQHVAACIKHFAANNQEVNRNTVNTIVDERTLNEIYFPAFKASVQQGNAYTVMSAYNKINGYWCSENDYLLNKTLKQKWGFKGAVISDWGGVHTTVAAANAGLDIEMGSSGPFNKWFFADPLLEAVKSNKVTERLINDKVHRILWVMFHTSMSADKPAGSISTLAHNNAAYRIASEAIVLLKNEKNLLPLNTSQIKSVAVIGDNATHKFAQEGFGAGVKAKYEITALAGLKNKFPKQIVLKYAQGYKANYLAANTAEQNAKSKEPDERLIKEAVDLAKTTEVVLLVVGSNREYESEGTDRKDLQLPFGEQLLIDAVTAANANTIVVVTGGAPYDLGMVKRNNHTIVWSWFNGSEGGNALADVLTGTVNPSGKLPFTFPEHLKDSPAFALNTYPGENMTAEYKEGILVGYRWFDTKKIEPLYCFGYGLSYTQFKYSGLHTNKKAYNANDIISVSISLKNTGARQGKETIQLYVNKVDAKVIMPAKQLKAFAKPSLAPGKSLIVKMNIAVKDLAYYSVKEKKWIVEPGSYKILAGSSSRDIRQAIQVTIN